MTFMRAGYPGEFLPIVAKKRQGKSHIKPIQDGLRFLVTIFKIATLYAPLKLFLPTSLGLFALGLCYYLYTYITRGQFTNMSLLLLSASVIIFLIGRISGKTAALDCRERNGRETADPRSLNNREPNARSKS